MHLVMRKKIDETLDQSLCGKVGQQTVLGLDIGSRTGKAALFHEGQVYCAIVPTGVYSQETADRLTRKVFGESGVSISDVSYIVGTGYGRVILAFEAPYKMLTEISCHGMGAHYLDASVQTIVDIGGQDSKAIRIDPTNGRVIEFIMNDKCAAGCGIFLEKAALLLDFKVGDFGAAALEATAPAEISSQCVVFAESEIISLKARGTKREDIAAGIHLAVARRVKSLVNRIGIAPSLLFTGGVSYNQGMKKALEEALGLKSASVGLDPIYAGALGAAILAGQALASPQNEEKKVAYQWN